MNVITTIYDILYTDGSTDTVTLKVQESHAYSYIYIYIYFNYTFCLACVCVCVCIDVWMYIADAFIHTSVYGCHCTLRLQLQGLDKIFETVQIVLQYFNDLLY